MIFDIVWEFAKRDFKEKYTGSILGLWWAFIWPAVNIFIYTFIFSKIMSVKLHGIPSNFGYGLYLASGLFPWTAFSNTVIRSANIFIEKKPIITKVPLPLPALPLAIALSESFTFLISFSILLGLIIFLKIPISLYSIYIPISYAILMLLAVSMGLFFATLNVFIRDIKEFINIFFQILFWLTPIVYTISILPEYAKKIISYNPIYVFISIFQNSLVTGDNINFRMFAIYSFLAILISLLSYKFYKKLSKDVRDFL